MDNINIIKEIARHIQKKFRDEKENILIAVTGPSCSGKTEFCRELIKHLPNSRIFFLDGYYYDINQRRIKGLTGAHPESIRNDILLRDLEKIRKNIRFEKLISNVSLEDNMKNYVPARYNIIDGFSALLVPDIDRYNFIIFIECDDDIQLRRRLKRDIKIRKRPKEEILPIFKKRNAQFNKFIMPKRKFSDIILNSSEGYKLTYVRDFDKKHLS